MFCMSFGLDDIRGVFPGEFLPIYVFQNMIMVEAIHNFLFPIFHDMTKQRAVLKQPFKLFPCPLEICPRSLSVTIMRTGHVCKG